MPVSSERKSRMKKSTIVLIIFLFGYATAYCQESLSIKKPERLFDTGLDLMAHHEYGAAYNVFGEFLDIHPASYSYSEKVDAAYYKAFCALNLYHMDGEKMLEAYIAAYPLYPKAITAYYDLANFFYNEKNFVRSADYFQKVDFPSLGNDQQNTGRFHWGYGLFSLKKLKEALDQFNTIKSQGGQYGPAASYYAGFIESANRDYPNALIDLKRAEANTSYASIVPVMIANVYYKQKEDDELLKYADAVLPRENLSSPEEISLLAAETYFRKANYQKALPLYINYLEGHENNADRGVLFRAGTSAYSLGDDDHAMDYLKAATGKEDSVGTYASYTLGMLYLKRQEKPLALTAYNVVKNTRFDLRISEESLFQCAKINYELGRADVSIEEFEELLKNFPQSSHGQETRELLSQAYVNANNYNKAIEYIEALPRRTPVVDRAYQKATYLKGTELFNKEDYASAVQYFEKSLQYPVEQDFVAEASYWCGEAYSLGRKYDQAIPFYEQTLGASPNPELLKRARYGLGYARYNLQQYDRALISFKEFSNRATVSDPNYLDSQIRLGDCYYAAKSYADALSAYRKAIQLKSDDADYAHLQVGIILVIQRKYGEAGNEFERVYIKTDSRFADDALFQRAQLDFEQSNYASAVDRYTQLISTSKSSRLLPYAYTRRAASYYNLKKFNQTADDYIAVLEKFPAHPVAQDLLLPLQESLNLASRSAEFEGYLAKFKLANPDAKGIEVVEFETAKNLYFNQNYPSAIDRFSRYALSYPESPRLTEARYYEGESYYRLKDFSKALSTFEVVSADVTFPMMSKVISRIAELEFRQGHYENAVRAFQKLGVVAGNKKEENIAWNGLMESYYLLANYDSADIFARKLLEQGNVNIGSQNKASLFLGKSSMARGDYETAKDEFLSTLNTARDEYGAEAKYLLAEIFYLNREFKQCEETLFALNTEYSSYTDWVGKSFLLLSDNYFAKGDNFQAKGTLKSLIENFPRQEIKDLAKEKLKVIEQEELSKKSKSDSTGNEK